VYRILQTTDWSFLIGGEVIQVAIGLHNVQLALFKDISISIECDFKHERAGRVVSGASEMHVRAATLVSLLGKTVQRVMADGEVALVLQFGGEETVTILVNDEPYECFHVNGPAGLIIV
jgi:hypothetical protein